MNKYVSKPDGTPTVEPATWVDVLNPTVPLVEPSSNLARLAAWLVASMVLR